MCVGEGGECKRVNFVGLTYYGYNAEVNVCFTCTIHQELPSTEAARGSQFAL